MGFKEIIYLGLDLKNDGANTHFFGHDYHSKNHETTEFPKMVKMLEFGARELSNTNVKGINDPAASGRGIRKEYSLKSRSKLRGINPLVGFNCSPVSQLECFSKVSYEHAISF